MKVSRCQVIAVWGLLLGVSMGTGGCGRKSQKGALHKTRTLLAEQDDFGTLLVHAGLAPEGLPTGEDVSLEEARRLHLLMALEASGSLRAYAPRRTAEALLREVFTRKEPVARDHLNARLQTHASNGTSRRWC